MDKRAPLRHIVNALDLQIDLVESLGLHKAVLSLKIARMELLLSLCDISQSEFNAFVEDMTANHTESNQALLRALYIPGVRH